MSNITYLGIPDFNSPWKYTVRVATTASITLSGTQTIDGVALSVGDRVLVKNQGTGSQNGIYAVQSSTWTREFDGNAEGDFTTGQVVFVREGTIGTSSLWILTTIGAITVGSTTLSYTRATSAVNNLGANTGYVVKTGPDTWATRTFTVTNDVASTAQLAIGNADGVSGGTIISIQTDTSTLKMSVEAATTANITLSGTQTVDGIALSANNRCLVKNQSTGADNGIYVVAAGAWTRATDYNTSIDAEHGLMVFVQGGTANGNKYFKVDQSKPTIDTTPLTFSETFGVANNAWAKNTIASPLYNTSLTDTIFHNAPVLLSTDTVSFIEPSGAVNYDNTKVGLYIKRTVTENDNSPGLHIRQHSAASTGDAVTMQIMELDPTNAPESVPFTMNMDYFDAQSVAGDNTTFHMGFNLNKSGASYISTEPSSILQFETKFAANSGNDQEIWFGFNPTTSGTYRPIYMTANRVDGSASVITISGNTTYFDNGAANQSRGIWNNDNFIMQSPITNDNFTLILKGNGTGNTSLTLRHTNNTNYTGITTDTTTLAGVTSTRLISVGGGLPVGVASRTLFLQDDGTGEVGISSNSTATTNINLGINTNEGFLGNKHAKVTINHGQSSGGLWFRNVEGSNTERWKISKGRTGVNADDLNFETDSSTSSSIPLAIKYSNLNVGIKVTGGSIAAPLHVHSQAATTSNIFRLENNSANIDMFVTTATPQSSVTGSVGDIAIDATNGLAYLKTSGSATNTGWTAFTLGGALSGTIATGQVAYATGTDTIGGSANFTYNASSGITIATGHMYKIADGNAGMDNSQSGSITFKDYLGVFTWRDTQNSLNRMRLNNGLLKIGDGSNPLAPLHVKSASGTTSNILRLENSTADIDFFVTTATPQSSVTGSIGDLAIDATNGIMYLKTSGTATNTGWTAFGAGGTIGGSITDNQIAVGASTANSIEGTADLTYASNKLLVGIGAAGAATTLLQLDGHASQTGDIFLIRRGSTNAFTVGGTTGLTFKHMADTGILLGLYNNSGSTPSFLVSAIDGATSIGGNTITGSAILDLNGTTKGFLPPRLTTAQKNAVGTPPEGLVVHDTDLKTQAIYANGAWREVNTRTVQIPVSDPGGAAITTGDGKRYIRVPAICNGLNLISVAASLSTVSSSGAVNVQIRRVRSGSPVDMLSTALTIDASEVDSSTAATAAVINTSNDDVNTADQIHIDIDGAGTGAKGLIVELKFG